MSETTVAAGTAAPLADGVGESSLALLLKRSEHALRQRFQATLDAEALLLEQWQIMAVLLAQPGMRMSELADAAVVPAATLTRHMDKLVERALVVRRIDPDDKRRVVAALSPMGKRLAVRLHEVEHAIEVSISEGLGGERFAALARELRLLPHLFD
ncbi:MAG: MarR family transcriptional regulator [Nocardioides sp.]|uniref:MarR family winged helix-turn-helix transcriptional regulator n=1 Tax=Nocardioides sp. TaxID=35761 RepID=UPI0039E36174